VCEDIFVNNDAKKYNSTLWNDYVYAWAALEYSQAVRCIMAEIKSNISQNFHWQ
jgi:hypothetical protein